MRTQWAVCLRAFFQLPSLRSNRNLVEQKSVLDCRRISRNFSQKRGQQKRPKQKKQIRNSSCKDQKSLHLHFCILYTQHTIINLAMAKI